MTAGQPRAYVSYFDQRYLALAITMLRSLRRHDPDALVFPLCFDALSFAAVTALGDPHIRPLAADELLAFEPRLRDCSGRSRWAFYATHKAILPLLLFARHPDLRAIVHVDADCWFFSSPAPLFGEIGEASIALSPHDFCAEFARLVIHGRFNAGFIYWRHDAVALQCLREYREDCLTWCEPYVEPDGRFMNQGYLTRWPERYPGVHEIRHPGVNVAYWNLAGRQLGGRWPVKVNGMPLVCYHFSGLFLDSVGIWRSGQRQFGANLSIALTRVYRPFLKEVHRADRWLRRQMPTLGPIHDARESSGDPVGRGPWPRTRAARLARLKWNLGLA